jgi:hypothetical protein
MGCTEDPRNNFPFMKFILLITVCCLLVFLACQPKTGTQGQSEAIDSTTIQAQAGPEPGATCYQKIINQDTFRLKVILTDGKAAGTLAYRFKEKDSSHGNLAGAMSGDTLFAIFDYMVKGKRSKREVAFLLSPTMAMEGYGFLEEQEEIMRFTSRKDLQFGNLLRMEQVACAGQPFDGLKEGE